jgi:uncharacterized DUF497 family protein
VRFEWDEAKNRQNRRKHGVDFEVAALVFDDPDLLLVRHTWIEERGGSDRLGSKSEPH